MTLIRYDVVLNLLFLMMAETAYGELPIVEQSTCEEGCQQFIPDGFLGDFARSPTLCSGPRFYVARNAIGTDDRFTFIEKTEIQRLTLAGSPIDNATEIRVSGYEQTAHTEGAVTADPVDVTMILVYNEDTERLTLRRPNAATETFVRCPARP